MKTWTPQLCSHYRHWTLGTATATAASTAPGHWEPQGSCEPPLSPFLCMLKSESKIWLVELSLLAHKLALRESGKIHNWPLLSPWEMVLPSLRLKMRSPEAKWSVNHPFLNILNCSSAMKTHMTLRQACGRDNGSWGTNSYWVLDPEWKIVIFWLLGM